MTINQVLIEIFRILSVNSHLPYYFEKNVSILPTPRKRYLHITEKEIISPVQTIIDTVFQQPGKLPDQFVEMPDFKKLVFWLNEKNAIRQLDHIGFCYTVKSQEKELDRIKLAMKGNHFRLYEMKSNDLAKWYFIGDATIPSEPMIEFLPVLPNDEQDLIYWMPHIHIDINTNLTSDQIISKHKKLFPTLKPIKYGDEWGAHCVRIRLGVVGGVNIMLDLSTQVRNLPWVRKHLLQEIT